MEEVSGGAATADAGWTALFTSKKAVKHKRKMKSEDGVKAKSESGVKAKCEDGVKAKCADGVKEKPDVTWTSASTVGKLNF